jgi:ubiquinone/menaquinone biosynthesis C-methylase UbiE
MFSSIPLLYIVFFLLSKECIKMNERVFSRDAARLRDKARTEILEIDRVVSLSIEHLKVSSVLDVGTGTALFAEAFAEKAIGVAGIDIKDNMVNEAKRLLPKGEFKVGCAENIPYGNGSFDLVFLGHVLHETDDTVKALMEAYRVARKRVVVLEWPYIKGKMGPPLAHRLRPDQVIASATSAGFKKVEDITLKHMVLYRMDIS